MSFSESVPRFFTATGFSFVLALLLSMSVAAYSLHSVRKFQDAEVAINQTQNVLQKLEETRSKAKDLVGFARSYAVTGNTGYLDTYITARDSLPSMVGTIRFLLAQDDAQAQRADTLAALMSQRIEITEDLIRRTPVSQEDIFNSGQDVTDNMRLQFNIIKAAQSTSLAKASEDSRDRALRTRYALVGGNLLSVLILISVFIRLRREMVKRHMAQLLAQRSASESEDLYNLAPCGYHSIDARGVVIKMNDTGLQWLGYAREEIVGKMKSTDLMTPESRRDFKEKIFPQFLRDGALRNASICFVCRDGTLFEASVNAVAVYASDGTFLMSRTVITDVSALKATEREIEKLNVVLNARACALELANKELEGFSYSVSHDLRAPLRVIGGYAMMLEEDFAPLLNKEGRRYVDVIRTNTRKMDALITDLLKLAKSTLTPLTITSIDMRKMAQKVIQDLEIDVTQTALSIGQLHDAEANATLLLQVWENLLTNAAKFSRNSPVPAILVHSVQAEDETLYCVEDNGVGIDVAQAPKLFDVFQRFHSQEDFPGTGVGLALVKRIITRHGGRVWAESEPGVSTRFYFSLPVIQTASVAFPENRPAERAA
jgi:PAS domain S-box-containing protein